MSADPSMAVPCSTLLGDGDARGSQKWIRADGCEEWPIGIKLSGARHYLTLQDWREIVAEATAAIDRRTKSASSPTAKADRSNEAKPSSSAD